MTVRLVLGLLFTVAALAVAGRRIAWLVKLIRSGKPALGRLDGIEERVKVEVAEVLGQRKLLKWTAPGLAHFFTFWGFVVLGLTIVEAYGALVDRTSRFPFSVTRAGSASSRTCSRWPSWSASCVRDLRLRPHRPGGRAEVALLRLAHRRGVARPRHDLRWSSYAAALPRRAVQHRPLPVGPVEGAVRVVGRREDARTAGAYNQGLETFFLLAQVAVIFGFTIIVVVLQAPAHRAGTDQRLLQRVPDGLGPLLPVTDTTASRSTSPTPRTFEDDVFGVGKIEHFTWKGLLDFSTCTECGRCQSQCPAWNTGKPLSPKLLIMALRDHAYAKAPYLLARWRLRAARHRRRRGARRAIDERTRGVRGRRSPAASRSRSASRAGAQAERPLIGTAEENGVIDPDVLWSCTTCGACVEQCPVDIEHIDHIVDMRRYQVMIESAFPSEAGVMLKQPGEQGQPLGLNDARPREWITELDFEVAGVGEPGERSRPRSSTCSGSAAPARSTTARRRPRRRSPSCCTSPASSSPILGAGETCTGDPARRLGNEFLFQKLASRTSRR